MMKPESNNFNGLEAMRGVAALMVVFFHMNSHWPGHLAVDFFLVLSGFILTHTYLGQENKTSKRDFIIKRIARLYPLHIFTLVMATIFSLLIKNQWPVPETGFFSTLLQQLTLTNNIGLNERYGLLLWNWPSWSISVELWINIFFIFFITRATKNWVLVLGSTLCLGLIFINSHHLNVHYTNYYTALNAGLLRGFASFFLGIVAYRTFLAMQTWGVSPHFKTYAGLYEALLLVGLVCVLLIRNDVKSPVDFFAPPLFFLMVILFARENGFISRGLKEIRYLGTISYSIYLNQIFVLMICSYIFDIYHLNQDHIMVAVILSLIVTSHFTYRYIECPSKAYIHKKFLNRTPPYDT